MTESPERPGSAPTDDARTDGGGQAGHHPPRDHTGAPDSVIDLTDEHETRVLVTPTGRLERDVLGPRTLPADALYGIGTLRNVERLAVSPHRLSRHPAYVRALGAVKQAAARANTDAGVLERDMAAAIDRAANHLTVADPAVLPHLPVDLLSGGGPTAVDTNVGEVVANLANRSLGQPLGGYEPIGPQRHVGASQHPADVCHTAIRLAVLHAAERLDRVLASLIETTAARAADLATTTTVARVHLRPAGNVALGALFDGSAAALARRRAALQSAAEPLAEVTLGGTVLGTGEGAPARYRERVVPHLCEITGRALGLHAHRQSALQHSDDLLAYSSQLALLAQTAAKLARDLRLLGSGPGGFGEIVLPTAHEGATPAHDAAIAETVLGACAQVAGHDRATREAGAHAELHRQVFEHVAAVNLLQATELLAAALVRFDHGCLFGLGADAERCAELAAGAHVDDAT